ncbi:M14 family metallopeptidase [Cognatitamlana onchidii]|uniref:succinylglutamate desuccinylase/aspartoacylase domain-containing protein n=1 Tax=Cognatitamlana onchidii TaxID=2562860 RepID=UPI0010A69F9B|nr:succinylglutamate desuccinylase/aspartoacylase family protein [Algibacter onchidii]
MIDVYSKALDKYTKVNRVIGRVEGLQPGPTVVFFAGIHGNETSGVFAIKSCLQSLTKDHVRGVVYGISGNLRALKKHQRYINEDLNRLWTKPHIDIIKSKTVLNPDEAELLELLEVLNDILKNEVAPFYFIDLHTTSSRTLPFITINDALINRKFSQEFPVPIVLGIEEYLSGPLLSYINELGYVSLGFESGQHDELNAITYHEAFVYLSLKKSGVLDEQSSLDFSYYHNLLFLATSGSKAVFEVVYLHSLKNEDAFSMLNGFDSFQPIKKGIPLAIHNNKELKAPTTGSIFMPLYQKRGSEGFFIIKPIKPFFLRLSALLRKVRFDGVLVLLPGVSWANKKEGILQVNLNIAHFFAKSFFHLLGYRSRHITETHLRLNNRERVAKSKLYKKEAWY